MERTRILLTSDLHLGLNAPGKLPGDAERLSTLKKICSIAMKHDILLVAGDLIHGENTSAAMFDAVNREFSALREKGLEIYYTPGMGELLSDSTVNPRVMGLDVTRVFSEVDESLSVKSGKGDIFIYGTAVSSGVIFSSIKKRPDSGFHIGLFNAGFNPAAEKDPGNSYIGKDDIKKMNLDFYALGGNHGFRVFRLASRIIGSYAGSPEPCSWGETGDRFAISIELEKGAVQNVRRVSVNTVRIVCETIDCSGLSGEDELEEKIKSTLNKENCYMLSLMGVRDFIIDESFGKRFEGHFRGIDLVDRTSPVFDILITENSSGSGLQAGFFKRLAERMDGDGEKPTSGVIAGLLGRNARGRRIFCDL